MDRGGSPNDPRGSSLGCLVVIGSGGVLESWRIKRPDESRELGVLPALLSLIDNG